MNADTADLALVLAEAHHELLTSITHKLVSMPTGMDQGCTDVGRVLAARLIAKGWTRLTPERLAEALMAGGLISRDSEWLVVLNIARPILAALQEPSR